MKEEILTLLNGYIEMNSKDLFLIYLENDIDQVIYTYRSFYSDLKYGNESYNTYMKDSLSTYIQNDGKMFIFYIKNNLDQVFPIGNVFLYTYSKFYGIGSFLLFQMYRKKGYSKKCFNLLLDTINTSYDKKPFLLSCKKELIPYYESLGFYLLLPTEIDGVFWMSNDKSLFNNGEKNEYQIF